MKPSSLLILLLALSVVPIAYAEEIAIPISFQEISGISGGAWSTTITGNVTTIQLSGILNHNTFDVTNLQAQLEMSSNDEIFCTVISTISSLTAGQTDNFVWTCPSEGIADAASGSILGYDLATIEEEVIPTNGTSSNSTSTATTSTTTQSSSSSSEDEPKNEITTNFVIGEHDMSIIVADYQGTSKFVTFTGGNFTTSETIDIEVTDSNSGEIVKIQTIVNGGGNFSVPAIVDTTTLSNENYNVTLKSQKTDLAFVISWTGAVFSFEGETVPSTSSETSTSTPSTTTSTTPTSSTTSSTGNSDLKNSLNAQIASLRAVISTLQALIDSLEAQIAMVP